MQASMACVQKKGQSIGTVLRKPRIVVSRWTLNKTLVFKELKKTMSKECKERIRIMSH